MTCTDRLCSRRGHEDGPRAQRCALSTVEDRAAEGPSLGRCTVTQRSAQLAGRVAGCQHASRRRSALGNKASKTEVRGREEGEPGAGPRVRRDKLHQRALLLAYQMLPASACGRAAVMETIPNTTLPRPIRHPPQWLT
jgi:hypothetical protein